MSLSGITSNIWTKNITNTTGTITAAYAFVTVSIVLISGSATITGDLTVNGVTSDALALTLGLPVTIVSKSNNPIAGITINASAGTVQIIGQQ